MANMRSALFQVPFFTIFSLVEILSTSYLHLGLPHRVRLLLSRTPAEDTRVSLRKKKPKEKGGGGFGHEDTMGAIPWKETAGSLLLLGGGRQWRREMGVERGGRGGARLLFFF